MPTNEDFASRKSIAAGALTDHYKNRLRESIRYLAETPSWKRPWFRFRWWLARHRRAETARKLREELRVLEET